MYQFWKNNKNVLTLGFSLFVISVTALMVMLNNGALSSEMKTDLIHGDEHGAAAPGQKIEYGPYLELEDGPAVIVGTDGMINFANEKYEENTSFSEEDLKGQLFFNYIHPEDLAGVLSAYGKVLSSKEPETLVGPFRMKNAAGEYTIQMAAMQPVMEEEKMTGVAVKTQSISHEDVYDNDIEIDYEESADEVESTDENTDEGKIADEEEADEADVSEEEEMREDDEAGKEEEIREDNEVREETERHEEKNVHENENKNGNGRVRGDKQIRNESNGDKRLVVDNLARVINKVYRDPDVLAYLF